MKAKLIIKGKEIEIEISEEEYKKLQPSKTGYERVPENCDFYYESSGATVELGFDERCYIDDKYYDIANYYSSDFVAENNARADKLMRQLRRFAVQHRECGVNFNSTETAKHYIYYDCIHDELDITFTFFARVFGMVYFDSEETAQAAIDEFREELSGYFTEYKDSL